MKTKILTFAILSLWSVTSVFAQDRTTVTATNSDISDNLDLRAVASIFGDSQDLADFERRLNDPKTQISNLDLNGDNQVDYLRVIESVEGNAHLIIIQSVLGQDTFQDIATIEVERDNNNQVQVQVVGDVYMYGNNYVYEPVYSYAPPIYTSFWVGSYRPYYSSWYWGYYPSYYSFWAPYPIYTYHNHIHVHINSHHHYNYVNYRRNTVVYNNYYSGGRRQNAYERQYPNRSFAQRNVGYNNRRELVASRPTSRNSRSETVGNGRNNTNSTTTPRAINTTGTRNQTGNPRSITVQNDSRSNDNNVVNPRTQTTPRSIEAPRTQTTPRVQTTPRSVETPRAQIGQRAESPRAQVNTRSNDIGPRVQTQRAPEQRSSGSSQASQPRGNSQGGEGRSNGGRR